MRALLGVIIAACIGASGAHADTSPDPDATRPALAALLAAAPEPLVAGSSCAGDYLTGPEPTIGDLLAMQLAYLYKGENVVAGGCEGPGAASCSLSVRHSAGESQGSATISFETRDGVAVPDTLKCVITP